MPVPVMESSIFRMGDLVCVEDWSEDVVILLRGSSSNSVSGGTSFNPARIPAAGSR